MKLASILTTVAVLTIIGAASYNEAYPFVCEKEKTVVTILGIEYRGAINVELDDGTKSAIGQRKLTLGDKVCMNYVRKGRN